MSKIIAIMQPTYLPWIGYLAMIDRVDEFVFLDNVQFDHRSWQQRNQIKTAQGQQWLTVPVQIKGKRDSLIKDVEVVQDQQPLLKHLRSIEASYRKASYFSDYYPELQAILSQPDILLSDLNIRLITWLCLKIGIATPLLRASALKATGVKADLLAHICQERSAKIYVSAPGSADYIQATTAFDDAQVKVVYHHYTHPVYPQLYGDFLPYMCALDLLFNSGHQSLKTLRSGVQA